MKFLLIRNFWYLEIIFDFLSDKDNNIKMLRVFKYRIYPTKFQIKSIERHFKFCCLVYNKTLEIRRNLWEQDKKSLSLFDTHKILTQWKEFVPDLRQVYSQVLQNVQLRVDLAFKAFFRRCKAGEKPGYPRFKSKNRYNSLAYPQWIEGFHIKEKFIQLPKLGKIKIALHRPIEGKIKTVTIKKTATDKWFATFVCEVDPKILPIKTNAVGIDVGLTTFAMFSDGNRIENPRFYRKEEKALAKAQRKFSKCAKNTPERAKYRRVVAKVHERIANKRSNFVFQEANKIVNNYGIIAIENLNIKAMVRNHCLAKSISDASWGQFFNQLIFKAEYAGRKVAKVAPNGTSQRCSRCGAIVKKELSTRIHSCLICSLEIDRDLNASINILALGLQGMGLSPKSPQSCKHHVYELRE